MAYTTRFDIKLGDLSHPAENILLIQVLEDGLRLLAIDQQHQPLLYQLIEFDRLSVEQGTALKDWMSEQAEWLKKWSKLIVIHHGLQAAFVPALLLMEHNGKELLDLQFGDLFRGTTLSNQVAGRQDYAISRVSSEWYKLFSAANDSVQQHHLFSLWLPWLDNQPVDPNGQVYLLFESKQVAMAIRKEDWQLVQIYEFQVPEDISYYLLSALEQLELSPETVKVSIDGWIDTGSSLYQELYKYLRNIETAKLPEETRLDKTLLLDQPVHYFTPLIQMATCVS